MNITWFTPARNQPSRPGPGRGSIGLGGRAGALARAAVVLGIGLAPLGVLGCGTGQPGSVTQGCRDLAGSQGSAGGDIWGQVAADAHGTPLGATAADLEKLTVVRASTPAYRTDLRRIITLCGRAGITV